MSCENFLRENVIIGSYPVIMFYLYRVISFTGQEIWDPFINKALKYMFCYKCNELVASWKNSITYS